MGGALRDRSSCLHYNAIHSSGGDWPRQQPTDCCSSLPPSSRVRVRGRFASWRPADRCTPSLGSQPDRALQKPPLALATVLLALPLLPTGPALAQQRIPKLPGYDECPLGYVIDLKQHCN